MARRTLRVGMIGYRFMGKAHSNGWRQAPRFFPLGADVDMHTVCGRDPVAVEKAAAELGWRNASADWRAVVESPEIDVVDITTPNDSHAEIAIAAARAGKHVLCEKPLAMTVEECGRMLEAVRASGVVHMVCHNYRRIPAVAQARKMIGEGAIGEIYHYRRPLRPGLDRRSPASPWSGASGRRSAAAGPTGTSTPTSSTWGGTWSGSSPRSAA